MSIEKKDSKLDNAERSSKLFYLRDKEKEHVRVITDNIKTAKTRIIEYAQDLAQRIDLKDEKLSITEHYQIGSYIKNELRDAGINEHKINYVSDCLEKHPEYKDHRYDKLTKGSVNRSLENLNPVPLEELKTYDDKTLRTFIQNRKADTDHAFFEAENRGLVDRSERKREKITTWKPKPGKSEMYYAAGVACDESLKFNEILKTLVERLYEYPPTDEKADKEAAERLLVFAEMIKFFNLFVVSVVDQRYAYHLMKWFRVIFDLEQFPKHGAAMEHKVPIIDKDGKPTGKFRPVTTKSIKGNIEKMKEHQELMTTVQLWFKWINGLAKWRDVMSSATKAIATRRAELSDKLSESS